MTDEPTEVEDPPDAAGDLLVACLREPWSRRDSVLAGLSALHPELAEALQARYRFLQDCGLIEGPQLLAATTPERIGDFRIVRRLGQGGMGVVYLAEQERLGRSVALKVIQPGATAPPRARERFRREALVAASLDHPNVCPVLDAGEVEGVPYLAMRYVEGETLAERIARRGAGNGPASAADIAACVALGEQLARALHAAHEQGLVHRDVKPANVMLEASSGRPLLLDFGLAQLDDADAPTLTLSGDRIGTPAYMAPEQVAGQATDRRTDVYALGATLYEAVTGRVPHAATTREALYRRILEGEITHADRRNPRVPRDLAVVLATALDREPDRRYRTAHEFAEDLARVRRREPVLAQPPGPLLRLRRWLQRNPFAATALLVFATGLAATITLWLENAASLRQRDAALTMRRVYDVLPDDPGEALRLAMRLHEVEPSPTSRQALRAAVHAPQCITEVGTAGKIDTSFALWRGAVLADSVMAWCDRVAGGPWRLWIRRGGVATPVEPPLPGTGMKFCTRFAPDGRRIAVASQDGPAVVYDLERQRFVTLALPPDAGPAPRVWSVAWHPQHDVLAVGIGNLIHPDQPSPCEVVLYDVTPDREPTIRWRRPVEAWPMLMQFTDDGRHVVVAPGMQRLPSVARFTRWHVSSFTTVDGRESHHAAHSQPCLELAVRGDRVATVGHDGRLVLWDLGHGGEPRVHAHPAATMTVDFAPDALSVVTTCVDGRVRVFGWDGTEVRSWPTDGIVEAAAFHPGGRMLVVQSPSGREIRTLDGGLVARLPGGHGTVRREFFVDADHLVTADFHRVRLWRLWPAGLRPRVLPPGHRPFLSPSGAHVASAGLDRVDMLTHEGTPLWSHAMPTRNLVLDESGRVFQATDERRLVIVGPGGRAEPTPDATDWPLSRLGSSAEGDLLAVFGKWRDLFVLRREPDGWRPVVTERPLAAIVGQEDDIVVQRDPIWLRPAGPTRSLLVPTQRGLIELALAGDEVSFVADLLPDEVINGAAVSADEASLALYTMSRELHLFGRDGAGWRKRCGSLEVGVDRAHVAFDARGHVLLTTPAGVRIHDGSLRLVDALPDMADAGLLACHRLPDADRVVTIDANFLMREWRLDEAWLVAEAKRLLRQ